MINIAKKAIGVMLPLVLLSTAVRGQDTPAVTAPSSNQGFSLPDVPGTLHFGLTASGGLRTGYYQNLGNVYDASFSGDAGYLSKSETKPFSATYSGGYSYHSSGQPGSFFQNLRLSQSFMTRAWSFVVTDSVNYLPESPSSGLSGIPGLGDLGVGTTPGGPDPGQDLLSNFGQRVGNTTTVSVERNLTGSTSLQGAGTYYIERFLSDTGGLDIDQVSAQLTLTHRIDALQNLGGNYTYSRSSYPGASDFTFTTQGLNVQYSRQWNRQVTSSASVGPQISTTPAISSGGIVVRPANSSISIAATASLSYASELTSYSLNYFRGVRTGSGVVSGTISDNVIFEASRKVGRYVHLGASGAYNHSETLAILTPVQTSLSTVIANLQASRAIGENLSGYISYGLQKQIIQGADSTFNGFNGLSQTAAIGITYSPNALHLGH